MMEEAEEDEEPTAAAANPLGRNIDIAQHITRRSGHANVHLHIYVVIEFCPMPPERLAVTG